MKPKSSFKMSKNTKNFLLAGSPWWFSAVTVMLGGVVISDILSPPEPIAGVQAIWVSLLLISFGLCLGWILHGVGFVIIKVSK